MTTLIRPRIVLDCIYYAVAISFSFILLLFLDQRGRPDPAGDDAGSGHLRPVRLQALRENDLYPAPAAARELRHRCGLHRAVRSPSPTTCTPNTTRSAPSAPATGIRPICHGRRDDGAGLEYSRKRHMPLFVLNIVLILYAVYGYVVPGMFHHAGPELGARRHRHERRDHDRRVLQPAADRAHGDRRVPAGAEHAERLRLHRIAACAPPSASRSARRTRCRSRRWSARCASAQ